MYTIGTILSSAGPVVLFIGETRTVVHGYHKIQLEVVFIKYFAPNHTPVCYSWSSSLNKGDNSANAFRF